MICPKNKCTGCFACYNICPQNAIKMVEDDYGYIYPVIDKNRCIKCNLCKNVCQYYNTDEFNIPKEGFAAISKDNNIYQTTTSGGIATVISKRIIENDGVVYGTGLENGKINVIRIDKIEDLDKIKGSKYVHSYVGDSYRNIKEDLKCQKKVLFIGTPCQVNGLQLFLRKEYNNLFTIDLVCHGVPSQKFLYEEKMRKLKNNFNIDYISFRGKNGFELKIKDKTGMIIDKSYNNRYYYAFLKAITYRENCYTCKYATEKRCGDITLGDFWGLKTKVSFEHKKGINCVLINTDKGNEMFDMIKEDIFYKNTSKEEIINGNDQLRNPSKKNEKRDVFLKLYKRHGYNNAINKAVFPDFYIQCLKKNIKESLKKNKIINCIYRKIK